MRRWHLSVIAILSLAFLLGSSGRDEVSDESADSVNNLTLVTTQFHELNRGMTVHQAQRIVGTPTFIRESGDAQEHIYVLEGEEAARYNFVSLFFDRETEKLVKGLFQEPRKQAVSEESETAIENLKSLVYIG